MTSIRLSEKMKDRLINCILIAAVLLLVAGFKYQPRVTGGNLPTQVPATVAHVKSLEVDLPSPVKAAQPLPEKTSTKKQSDMKNKKQIENKSKAKRSSRQVAQQDKPEAKKQSKNRLARWFIMGDSRQPFRYLR